MARNWIWKMKSQYLWKHTQSIIYINVNEEYAGWYYWFIALWFWASEWYFWTRINKYYFMQNMISWSNWLHRYKNMLTCNNWFTLWTTIFVNHTSHHHVNHVVLLTMFSRKICGIWNGLAILSKFIIFGF